MCKADYAASVRQIMLSRRLHREMSRNIRTLSLTHPNVQHNLIDIRCPRRPCTCNAPHRIPSATACNAAVPFTRIPSVSATTPSLPIPSSSTRATSFRSSTRCSAAPAAARERFRTPRAPSALAVRLSTKRPRPSLTTDWQDSCPIVQDRTDRASLPLRSSPSSPPSGGEIRLRLLPGWPSASRRPSTYESTRKASPATFGSGIKKTPLDAPTSPPRRACIEGYEALRAFVLEPGTHPAVPRGFGVLRGRGLAAWVLAVSSPTPPAPATGPPTGPVAGAAPCAPASASASASEMVHVLAAMALAAGAQGAGR